MTLLVYFNKNSSLSLLLSFVITEKFVSVSASIVCCCFTMCRYTKLLGQPVSFVAAKSSMFAAVANTSGKAENSLPVLCLHDLTLWLFHNSASVFSKTDMIERKSCHGNTFLPWLSFPLWCTKHKLRMCRYTLVSHRR